MCLIVCSKMAFSDSDSDYDLHLSSEFELSEDYDRHHSDSDSDDDDNDYDEQWSDEGQESDDSSESSDSVASSDFSPPPSPPPQTFRLLQDPFADNRPNDLPPLSVDFPDVHPAVIQENEDVQYSELDCFMLCIGKDVIEKLCE